MARLIFATHPDVVVDPATPVPDWGLSAVGRARMAAFVAGPACVAAAVVWTSPERKAREAAAIAADRLDVAPLVDPDLAEIDRESVGFVPEPRFSELRDRFFAAPDRSPDGWEPAVDAQRRIVAAIDRILSAAQTVVGDVLVVSHGAVGALTLAAKRGAPISVSLDQPRQGCWFVLDRATGAVDGGWREMPPADR